MRVWAFPAAMQEDVLENVTPDALVSLAGEPAGRAAYLSVRLACVVTVSAGLPFLLGPFRHGCRALQGVGAALPVRHPAQHDPCGCAAACPRSCSPPLHCRDALWRVLFWQPLLPGPGHLLITLAVLAGVLLSSLHAPPLGQLLRWACPGERRGRTGKPWALQRSFLQRFCLPCLTHCNWWQVAALTDHLLAPLPAACWGARPGPSSRSCCRASRRRRVGAVGRALALAAPCWQRLARSSWPPPCCAWQSIQPHPDAVGQPSPSRQVAPLAGSVPSAALRSGGGRPRCPAACQLLACTIRMHCLPVNMLGRSAIRGTPGAECPLRKGCSCETPPAWRRHQPGHLNKQRVLPCALPAGRVNEPHSGAPP